MTEKLRRVNPFVMLLSVALMSIVAFVVFARSSSSGQQLKASPPRRSTAASKHYVATPRDSETSLKKTPLINLESGVGRIAAPSPATPSPTAPNPCRGASPQVRELGSHPKLILLGVGLGLGAVLAHCAGRLVGQPLTFAVLSSAQLGVPVAAAEADKPAEADKRGT